MPAVCVFCGSRSGADPRFALAARDLGAGLARRGWPLVYGGGKVGLMGEVARAAFRAGGTVVGVIPTFMERLEVPETECAELIRVPSMHARKALMAERSGAFAVLPGGFGTCDELFEILTWRQIGLHAKPVVLVNVGGFFDPLLALADHMSAHDFLKPEYRAMLFAEPDAEAALDRLAAAG